MSRKATYHTYETHRGVDLFLRISVYIGAGVLFYGFTKAACLIW